MTNLVLLTRVVGGDSVDFDGSEAAVGGRKLSACAAIPEYIFHFLQLIKVYGEDSHGRSVWVGPEATAREVCQMLVQTAHCVDLENWALLELYPSLGLGKTKEVKATAGMERFRFHTHVPPLYPQSDVWRTTSW